MVEEQAEAYNVGAATDPAAKVVEVDLAVAELVDDHPALEQLVADAVGEGGADEGGRVDVHAAEEGDVGAAEELFEVETKGRGASFGRAPLSPRRRRCRRCPIS